MTAAAFMTARIIRLMPLIVVATAVGAAYVLARALVLDEAISIPELGVATLFGMLNLPFLGASSAIGGPQVFPLNGPQYTLFLEFVVNLVWALTGGTKHVRSTLVIAAVALVVVIWNGLGGYDVATFWQGFPQVFMSFYLGIVAFHVDRRLRHGTRLDGLFWAAFVLMVVLFFLPVHLPFTVELVWIVVLSPVIVLAGARASLGERMTPTALALGALSYPIYVLHYPIFCWLNGLTQIVLKRPDVLLETALMLIVVPAASFILLRFFDEPVRAELSRLTRQSRLAS